MKKRAEILDQVKFVGERFNRLVCIEELPKKLISSRMHRMGRFKCDCGNLIEARLRYVWSERVRSCGCLAAEVRRKGTKKKRRGLEVKKRLCRECKAPTHNYFHCPGCLSSGAASIVSYGADLESGCFYSFS